MLYDVVVIRQQAVRWLSEVPQYWPDSSLYGFDTVPIGTWRYGVVGYRDGEAWRDLGVRTKTPTGSVTSSRPHSQRKRVLPAQTPIPAPHGGLTL